MSATPLGFDPFDPLSPFSQLSMLGLSIVSVEERYEPVIKLSEKVPVGDTFRREMNDWLVEMFGMRDVTTIPKGSAIILGGSRILMRSRDAVKLSSLL